MAFPKMVMMVEVGDFSPATCLKNFLLSTETDFDQICESRCREPTCLRGLRESSVLINLFRTPILGASAELLNFMWVKKVSKTIL